MDKLLRKKSYIIAFLAPAFILFTGVLFIPICKAVYYSFCNYKVNYPIEFTGLKNYIKLFTNDETMKTAFKNSMFFMIFSCVTQLLFGLVLAALLTNIKKGRNVFKNIYYLPCVLSSDADHQAKVLSRKINMIYKGSADVQMPRNYIASNIYPMLSAEEISEYLSRARVKIPEVSEIIKAGGTLTKRHVYIFEALSVILVAGPWRKFILTAKAFYAEDSCIGCGKCAKLCPLNNIKIEDKKPVWGKKCTHCMACIANCPKESIEYGKITQGKDRYLFKKWEK